ncbi:MAG: hypothetical protein M1814_006203 [Vezdaea aestivalis]|nr:MAG: hypothetical protein M1814_006203 [Vezdaea aestivalis]
MENSESSSGPPKEASKPPGKSDKPSEQTYKSDEEEPLLQLPAICDPPGPGNPHKQAVWIIYGATGLLGRTLVMRALEAGDLVAAVGRSHEELPPLTKGLKNGVDLLCDVRVQNTVEAVVKAVNEKWGRVDIVVNCSGTGVMGACEDQTSFEIEDQFDTNVMGTLYIVQTALPILRAQGYGRFLLYSSTAALAGLPGGGPYCATKYATEALTESLHHEIAPFNIQSTLIQVGLVRRPTNITPTWGHFRVVPASAPYDYPEAPAGFMRRMGAFIADQSPSSAQKVSEIVWQLGHCSYPPVRLLLGKYAVDSARDRWKWIIEEIEDWKHLNFSDAGSEQDTKDLPILSPTSSASMNSQDETLSEGSTASGGSTASRASQTSQGGQDDEAETSNTS